MAERKSIKLDRLWLCLTFCGVVAPEGARAGVLELLSRGAHALSSGTCPGYDNSAVARALNQADAPCEPIRPFSRIQGQAEELAQIGNKALGTYEDQFFALLAKQHSRELVCSGSFADSVAAGTPEVLNNIATKMQLMRAAKLQLNRAAQNLESDMDAMTKICPSSMDELKPNPAYAGLVDKTYEYCKVILTSRIAYQTVLSSIPLGGVPPLNDFLDKFANLRDGPEYNQLSSSLNGKIQSLYGQVKSRLLQESQKLDNTVQAEGGAGFSRSARYALLSDPRVISKVVHDGGDDANLEGLACQADAAYGQGADDLSAGLMVGSIAFSGGAGLLARVGSIGWKIGEGAMAARAAGLLSINATRVLQLSALGVNSVTAYSMIDKACFGGSTPGVLANGTDDNGQCVSAPDVRQMAKDSCILDVSLAAIGFAAVVPSKDVRALLAKLKVSGQSVASV